jgi:hypothetical protein
MAKKQISKKDLVEVIVNCHNLAGKYLLSGNKGQTIKVEKKQAEELFSSGDGLEPKKVIALNAAAEKEAADKAAAEKAEDEKEAAKEAK